MAVYGTHQVEVDLIVERCEVVPYGTKWRVQGELRKQADAAGVRIVCTENAGTAANGYIPEYPCFTLYGSKKAITKLLHSWGDDDSETRITPRKGNTQ